MNGPYEKRVVYRKLCDCLFVSYQSDTAVVTEIRLMNRAAPPHF